MLSRPLAAKIWFLTLALASCKSISPKIDKVTGGGDTKVDTVEVGSVGGDGTTNVDTVNANINMGGILGNPYTIVKTAKAAPCPNEQSCKCAIVPVKTGILAPKENSYYVSKISASRTVIGCMMNSRMVNDASKFTVNIVPTGGSPIPATPIGSAKTLQELETVVK